MIVVFAIHVCVYAANIYIQNVCMQAYTCLIRKHNSVCATAFYNGLYA